MFIVVEATFSRSVSDHEESPKTVAVVMFCTAHKKKQQLQRCTHKHLHTYTYYTYKTEI